MAMQASQASVMPQQTPSLMLSMCVSHAVIFRSNHKSVLGIGGYARERSVQLSCVDEEGMEAWLSSKVTAAAPTVSDSQVTYSLVAYPAKDNYEGRLYPWDWVQMVRCPAKLLMRLLDLLHHHDTGRDSYSELLLDAMVCMLDASCTQHVSHCLHCIPPPVAMWGTKHWYCSSVLQVHAKSTAQHKWLVIADAAAYVPTHPLDLSTVHPDFVPISFYKMFGYPTGLGALIARKQSLALLHKVYWGGGSVLDATAQDTWRVLYSDNEGYMDGTRDFLGIAQLQFGFAQLEKLGGITVSHPDICTLLLQLQSAACLHLYLIAACSVVVP